MPPLRQSPDRLRLSGYLDGPDEALARLASLFAAVGHLGQYVLVSPEQKLTVVRLGKTDEPERDALVAALAKIVALYPET